MAKRNWKDDFDVLTDEEQAAIRHCAKTFGVPLISAFLRAKSLGLLKPAEKEPAHD